MYYTSKEAFDLRSSIDERNKKGEAKVSKFLVIKVISFEPAFSDY